MNCLTSAPLQTLNVHQRTSDSSHHVIGIIHGANINGSKAYLVNDTKLGFIDSTVIRNNKFIFTYHVKEPVNCTIWFKKSHYVIQLFLENTKVNIIIKMDPRDYSFIERPLIISNGYNQLLSETLYSLDKRFYDSLDAINRKYNVYKETNRYNNKKLKSITDRYGSIKDSIKEIKIQFMSNHMESNLAPIILSDLFREKDDLNQLKYYYNKLPSKIKNSYEGIKVNDLIHHLKNEYGIGSTVAPFSLNDSNKVIHSFFINKSLKNKYKMIIFWASWCAPCINEIPHLVNIFHKYGNTNIRMISISIDRNFDSWKECLKKYNLPWVQLIDNQRKQSISKKLGVQSIPSIFILDKSNRIIHIQTGRNDHKLSGYLDSLFKKYSDQN